MPLPVTLDHCVIHVSDWERSNAFYTSVLGAELITRPVGYAYRFGDRQLNVHGPGVAPAEVARLPVAPGNSDFSSSGTGRSRTRCVTWNAAALPSKPGPCSASAPRAQARAYISAILTAR
jgi:Glyoxalase/Bleomycin resistance protein/Dioxygenase superfamily